MAIRIINITENPATEKTLMDTPLNIENRHLGIMTLKWVDESSQASGEAPLENMYDWIANKRGQAYVKEVGTSIPIPIFGRSSKDGRHYVQAGRNGDWTTDLIDQLIGKENKTGVAGA